jgi:hypothetical protein
LVEYSVFPFIFVTAYKSQEEGFHRFGTTTQHCKSSVPIQKEVNRVLTDRIVYHKGLPLELDFSFVFL